MTTDINAAVKHVIDGGTIDPELNATCSGLLEAFKADSGLDCWYALHDALAEDGKHELADRVRELATCEQPTPTLPYQIIDTLTRHVAMINRWFTENYEAFRYVGYVGDKPAYRLCQCPKCLEKCLETEVRIERDLWQMADGRCVNFYIGICSKCSQVLWASDVDYAAQHKKETRSRIILLFSGNYVVDIDPDIAVTSFRAANAQSTPQQ